MLVCVHVIVGLSEQQPQLSSIGRDHDELRKKIAKLEKQREQSVSAGKLSDVCTLVVCCILWFSLIFLADLPYKENG